MNEKTEALGSERPEGALLNDGLGDVQIWRTAPDGEYGAWQYRYANAQGGEKTLKEALWQASFFAVEYGAKIEILPEGMCGMSVNESESFDA